MSKTRVGIGAKADAVVTSRPGSKSGIRVGGVFDVVCYGPDGVVKWSESAENLVTNVGLDYLLDAGLSGGTPITTWYVGLKDTGTPAAGDTLASHATWAELAGGGTLYTGNRPSWTDGGVSSQSVSNTASKASFSIVASDDVYGCFLCSVDTGTSGTLFAAVDFTGGARTVGNGDTLEVTYTFSAADDGA